MFTFLKTIVVERASTWTEFREIEFYANEQKINISNLSVVSSNMTNTSYPVSRAIDGDLNLSGGSNYVGDSSALPHEIVIKSSVPFDTVKFYDDNGRSSANYPSTKVEFYVSTNGIDWELASVFLNPSKTVNLVHTFTYSFDRSLIKFGNKYLNITNTSMKTIDDVSEFLFLEHGMRSGNSVDLKSKMNTEIDVTTKSNVLGSGKTFKHSLDLRVKKLTKITL